MNAKNLGKQAREQFKAGDRKGARESIKLMNERVTKREAAKKAGRFNL